MLSTLYKRVTKAISHIATRSVDWMIVVSYALHNVFLTLAVALNTSQVANYIEQHYGISPLWIIAFLMLGLIWTACLWLSWRTRLLGAIPLILVALSSVAVYMQIGTIRTVLTIAWIYLLCAVIPFVLAAVQGNLSDLRAENWLLLQRANELEHLVKSQEAKLIAREAIFGYEQDKSESGTRQ